MNITPRNRAVKSRRVGDSILVVLLSALIVSAAGLPKATPPAEVASVRHGPRFAGQDSISTAIQRLVSARPITGSFAGEKWRRVQRLYKENGYVTLWSDGTSRTTAIGARARVLINALTEASSQALDPESYSLAELGQALLATRGNTSSPESLARADVMLTAAFVAYASDLLTGQVDPHTVNRSWHIDPQNVDVDSALVASLRHEKFTDVLNLLRPQDREYEALIQEMGRYRKLVASGGWPRVRSLGTMRPGDTTTAGQLRLLLARLHAEGYTDLVPLVPVPRRNRLDTSALLGADAPVLYHPALAGAVAEYQRRHDLEVDSIVGPMTLASLNRPAEFRLRQIAANLERHRWLPRTRGDRYVLVNLPAFRLRAYDGGRETLTMNVVVGAEYGGRTTPVFSDSMSYVVFRPYWNVPQGIARRELWPKQRQDPSYFSRNSYEVVRASWGSYVRQKPGPDNALGQAKFIFPNDYAIYLHDTPAQALFAERVRAFSHGCIRVEHPDRLAEFVLGPQGWDIERVREAMTGGRDNHRVYLERKLPVYIVYFTTFVRDGALYFGNDIYDRDDALVRAVRGAAMPSDSLAREIEGLREVTRELGVATASTVSSRSHHSRQPRLSRAP